MEALKFNYSVGTPTGTVANEEMNVLYMQYDNKIMASGSGYPSTEASCKWVLHHSPKRRRPVYC